MTVEDVEVAVQANPFIRFVGGGFPERDTKRANISVGNSEALTEISELMYEKCRTEAEGEAFDDHYFQMKD